MTAAASRIPTGDVMPSARPGPQRGFTYLGLMILVTTIGLLGAAGLKMGSLFQRAAQEEELLEIGAQFSEALRSYAAATPPGKPQQPPTLQDLLRDPRFPNVRRHLRKVFVDPVTGKQEWGVTYLGDKVGVVAVYSLSDRRPLKIANFDIRFSGMENKERISDWKFVMAGGEGSVGGIITPPNSMTGNDSPGAPSLFPAPGAGAPASGGKGGAASGPGGGKDGPPPDQPAGAPAPLQPPPPDADEVPEVVAPVEPEEDTAKEEVQAEEKDGRARDDETISEPQPAVPILPPPVRRR